MSTIGGAACSLTALFGREQSFGSGFNAVARIAGGVDPSFLGTLMNMYITYIIYV
jgi:hypothetical protein